MLFKGNIVNSIGMVVAFIPEGLPAAVTLVLTIVAKRMYKQKVLVKSLATVETFNNVSVSHFILLLNNLHIFPFENKIPDHRD